MSKIITIFTTIFLMLSSFLQASPQSQEDNNKQKEMAFNPAIPEIKKLAENIYSYSQFMYNSIIMITENGVFVTDPSGAERALAMRNEIKKLTNLPVTKVIYSHDHYDHTRGGKIFKDEGAEFISHENALELIKRDPYKEAIIPTRTYKDKLVINLNKSSTLELLYYGPNDGNAMSVIYFPTEKILYAVDFHLPLYVNEPYRLVAHNYGGILNTLRNVKKDLDFKIVVPGHGPQSSPKLFDEDLRFVEALYNATLDGLKKGKKTEELMHEIKLPQFSHWRAYDRNLPAHIQRMSYTIWHGN